MKCLLFLLSISFTHATELRHWLRDNNNLRSVAMAAAKAYQKDFKNQQAIIQSVDPVETEFYRVLLTYTQQCCKNTEFTLPRLFFPLLMCNNTNSDLEEVRAEIERLREKAKTLKDEGFDTLGRGMFEAAGAGVSCATGAEPLGFWGGYYATKDIIEGCKEYAEGARKEDEADRLEEEFFPETPKKQWWELWK